MENEDYNMFTITPMSRKINLAAGETYTGSIVVANPIDATEDFAYVVTTMPYSVGSKDYKADLLTEKESSQIVKWIEIENPRGTIKPNEKAEISFTIRVPEDAPAGGQYAAILVGSDMAAGNGNGGINIQNQYEMASVIYARIAGDITRKGEIAKNNIPGFITDLPLTIGTLVKNEGNVHETVKVDVEVKNLFGNAQIYPKTGESGEMEEIIMPDTEYYVKREIDDMTPVGLYEVKQTVVYMGQTSTVAKIVIACPIWFMLMIALVLGLIVFRIIKGIRKHRKKRVIS